VQDKRGTFMICPPTFKASADKPGTCTRTLSSTDCLPWRHECEARDVNEVPWSSKEWGVPRRVNSEGDAPTRHVEEVWEINGAAVDFECPVPPSPSPSPPRPSPPPASSPPFMPAPAPPWLEDAEITLFGFTVPAWHGIYVSAAFFALLLVCVLCCCCYCWCARRRDKAKMSQYAVTATATAGFFDSHGFGNLDGKAGPSVVVVEDSKDVESGWDLNDAALDAVGAQQNSEGWRTGEGTTPASFQVDKCASRVDELDAGMVDLGLPDVKRKLELCDPDAAVESCAGPPAPASSFDVHVARRAMSPAGQSSSSPFFDAAPSSPFDGTVAVGAAPSGFDVGLTFPAPDQGAAAGQAAGGESAGSAWWVGQRIVVGGAENRRGSSPPSRTSSESDIGGLERSISATNILTPSQVAAAGGFAAATVAKAEAEKQWSIL